MVTAVLMMAADMGGGWDKGGWGPGSGEQPRWRERASTARAFCHLQKGSSSAGWLPGHGKAGEGDVKRAGGEGSAVTGQKQSTSQEENVVPMSSLE